MCALQYAHYSWKTLECVPFSEVFSSLMATHDLYLIYVIFTQVTGIIFTYKGIFQYYCSPSARKYHSSFKKQIPFQLSLLNDYRMIKRTFELFFGTLVSMKYAI